MSLLKVDGLTVSFATTDGLVEAVRDVSFTVEAGQTVAIVGESGCGKSVTALTLLGLNHGSEVSGSVVFEGHQLVGASALDLRRIRGSQIAMTFQDPLSSLHPLYRVGRQIADGIRAHTGATRSEARQQSIALLRDVGIAEPDRRVDSYPHELSGGMRQRVMIAMALALRPALLIADEPTTALDATVQAQIVELIVEIQQRLGMAVIVITHDLGVVARIADVVLVMYAGRVVEEADMRTLFRTHHHPYTAGLLQSIPATSQQGGRLVPIVGQPPSLIDPPQGCAFHPRCPYGMSRCRDSQPPPIVVAGGRSHRSACWLPSALTGSSADADQARLAFAEEHDGRTSPADEERARGSAGTGDVSAGHAEVATTPSQGSWQLTWRRLRRDRAAMLSAAAIALLVALAVCAPLIAHLTGHPAEAPNLDGGTDAAGLPFGPGTQNYLLGTDNLGRDILVRIAYGARVSLSVGVGATVIAAVAAVIVGLFAGYYGGWIDALLARFMDVVLSFPYLLFAIALVSVYGPSVPLTVVVIAFFNWAAIGRIVRGQTLSQREHEYVEASRSVGAGGLRVMFIDILPNLMGPVIVLTSLLVPVAVVVEASLSFLGLGVAPPTPSWGNMLSDAQSVAGYKAWWFWLFPSLALFMTTLAFNILGDSLRDALDPRTERLFAARARRVRRMVRTASSPPREP